MLPVVPPVLSNGLICKPLISSLHRCAFLFRVWRIRYTVPFWCATNKNANHLTLLCLMDISLLLQCKKTAVNEKLLLPIFFFFVLTVVVSPIMFSLSVFSKETPYSKTTIAQTLNSVLALMQSRENIEHLLTMPKQWLYWNSLALALLRGRSCQGSPAHSL